MTLWIPPPTAYTLLPGSLQVWRTRLDRLPESHARHSKLLSPGELARANRFSLAENRQRFIACRATLRLLLGNYLQVPPQSVLIEEGPQGKPIVTGSDLALRLKFNLSHSHDVAVLAFSKEREVGIDVEKIRQDFASHEIAQRYFSSQEIAELYALTPQLYTGGFFRCWTRKEAYIKARGQGLHIPLDSFSVSVAPGNLPELIASDSARWSMYSFEPFPEFVGAVVAEKFDWALSFYEGSDLL